MFDTLRGVSKDLSDFNSLFIMVMALINLVIAVKVFKINHNNSLAKISLIPFQQKTNLLENPQYINGTEDNHFYYDDSGNYLYGKRGYPLRNFTHEEITWYFELHNSSEVPALDVSINYYLEIYYQEFYWTKDNKNIRDLEDSFSYTKMISHSVNIGYLAPKETKKVFITKLTGAFSRADLLLEKLDTSDRVFIDKLVKIDTYTHPDLNIPDFDYPKVNLYSSYGLNDIEMREFLSNDEYKYYLKISKKEVEN